MFGGLVVHEEYIVHPKTEVYDCQSKLEDVYQVSYYLIKSIHFPHR